MLITPPNASLPNSTLDGPLVTSMRSVAIVLNRPMSRLSMSAPGTGSPSISTNTRESSKPRMEIDVFEGGAGSSCSPGNCRSS